MLVFKLSILDPTWRSMQSLDVLSSEGLPGCDIVVILLLHDRFTDYYFIYYNSSSYYYCCYYYISALELSQTPKPLRKPKTISSPF